MPIRDKFDRERMKQVAASGSANARQAAEPTAQPKIEQMQTQAPSEQLRPNAQPQQGQAVPSAVSAAAPSKAVQPRQPTPAEAQVQTQQAQAEQPAAPSWGGGYQSEIDDLFAKITGRQPFSYNINEDEMWNSLKDDYRRMGQDAMRDTMGRAAGLTGGYGSSYGQAAGQAAYDQYLTQLSERAPELYDRAYQRYQDEGDEQYRQLSALLGRDETAYNRFLQEREYGDRRGDLEYERARQEREYEDEKERYEREYGDRRGDIEYERARHELEYGDSRGDIEYQRRQEGRSYVMSLIQYGYKPTDEDLEAAGMTREEAEELDTVWGAENPEIAYRLGRISAEEYYRMTGKYPAGYEGAGAGEMPWWYYQQTGSESGGQGGGDNKEGLAETDFNALMHGISTSRSQEETQATIQRLYEAGTLQRLSEAQLAQLSRYLGG